MDCRESSFEAGSTKSLKKSIAHFLTGLFKYPSFEGYFYFMVKLTETGDMSQTAPMDLDGERYVGPDVNKDGKVLCPKCHKPYSECKCDNPENTVHSGNIPDDIQKIRMGNSVSPEEKKEEAMDFFDEIDKMMLEEFQVKKTEAEKPKPIEESMKNPTPEEVKKAKFFSESFHAYMERNGERVDRKRSSVAVKPNTSSTFKNLYYQDHFHIKNIH